MSDRKPNPEAERAWAAYVQEIRDAIPRVANDIYRRGAAQWRALGRGEHVCCSPLRPDKHPSFHTYRDGGCHDFGTGEGGDLFWFVMAKENVDFKGACDILAREIGIVPWDERKGKGGGPIIDREEMMRLWNVETAKNHVFIVMGEIAHLCWETLPSRAREHLKATYGFTDDFIDLEKIGFVPAGLWQLCLERLPHRSKDDLLASGFFNNPKDHAVRAPSAYQEHRILFPYWKDGLCVYTIGREWHAGVAKENVHVEEWDKGKYKKHATFDKETRAHVSPHIDNGFFWGEDTLRLVRRTGRLIVTEGVTDAAMLVMLGYACVSPVTISFRKADIERVLAMVRLYGIREIVIVNDNDTTSSGRNPGFEGAKRMASVLHANGVIVRVARLPRPEGASKIDVNEFCRDILRREEESAA